MAQQAAAQGAGGANLTAQIKRGYQALEDGDWKAAQGYFDKALDMDAECAEAFFGKALAAAKCVDGNALVQQRIEIAMPEEEELEACDRDEAAVSDAMARYTIPEYYPEQDIRDCFHYDARTYVSYTKGWETCITQEKTHWERTNRNLSRALRYAKGDRQKEYRSLLDQVLSALEAKRAESARADEKARTEITQHYAEEMKKRSRPHQSGMRPPVNADDAITRTPAVRRRGRRPPTITVMPKCCLD